MGASAAAPASPAFDAAATAAGAPAPFRGPAADSALGERVLDVLPIAFRHGHALELHRMCSLCGLTLRERASPGAVVATPHGVGKLVERRAADGVRVVRLPWATLYTRERVDERGFLGGPADVMARALKQQAPWLQAARAAPREDAQVSGPGKVTRTTSLMRAAAAGDERRVRELLAAGALLDCVDSGLMTALHHASLQGSTQVVAALLEADAAGATVDAQTSKSDTALVWASWKGHEGAVRLLLARGARQELQDENGMAALHWASQEGHAGVVEQLCAAPGAAAAVALRDEDGGTPLALAVSSGGGGERLVAALLAADAAGMIIDAQDNGGETALLQASYRGHEGAVRLLLARGARQELQDKSGSAVLYYAAMKGYVGIVEQLCAAPGAAAALAQRDKEGRTPLVVAVWLGGGGERLVSALLAADAAGVTIDMQNNVGDSALIIASEKGHEGAVRLLLARDARQELQCKDGLSALHWAAKNGHAGVVELLCAASGAAAALALRDKNGDTPLILSVSHGGGGERLVSALLAADAAGATVNTQNNKGDTALIEASDNGHGDAVRLLLARGARQELQNKVGASALHRAAEEGHAGVVEQLCSAPGAVAAVSLRVKSGNVPLALAVRAGHAAIATVLMHTARGERGLKRDFALVEE
jgi:serine/threonine-protein phosphatase 6 regulatory ankyrin repeat subunit B